MENPLGIKCDSPGCPQIVGASTKFCTLCGIRSKPIEFPETYEIVLDGGPYQVPLRGANEASHVQPTALRGQGRSRGLVATHFGLALEFDLSDVRDGETTEFTVETDDARERTDLWEPRPRRIRPLHLVARAPKIAVVPIPAVALFVEGREYAEVKLENHGNQTVRLGPPQVPYGFQCAETADAVGFDIAPNEKRTLRLRHTGGTPSILRLVTTKGEPVSEIRLLPAVAAKGKTPPGFVVAIDFGTSSTSVYCRETRTGDISAVSLLGDGKERRQTLLYAPLDAPRHTWRAIDVQGIPESRITRNLKTLLRNGDAGALERVRFYLESMLRGGIESELDARNPNHERTVEFVFTVPVLDHTEEGPGPQFTAYRDSLVDAACKAGYEDSDRGWSISTVMEPDGGALDVMNSTLSGRAFTDGDRLLVIDMGGGTTDIAFGRIRLTGGRPRLDETQGISIRVKGKQFGGERATELLGLAWGLADANGHWPPEGPNRSQQMADNQAEKVGALVEKNWVASGLRNEAIVNRWDTLAEPEDVGDEDSNNKPKGWQERFPELYTDIRRAKHHLSDEGRRHSNQLYLVSPYRFGPTRQSDDDTWTVPYDLLEEATRRSIQEIVDGLREFLEEQNVPPRSVAQVATIGGSSRLPGLQRQLADIFTPSSLIPLGDYVDVAVCRGASRVYQDPPPILPVGFEVNINGEKRVLAKAGASLAKPKPRRQQVTAPAHPPVRVSVDLVMTSGETVPFVVWDLVSYQGDVIVELTSSQIEIRLDPPSAAMPAVVVPLA